ncbi:related to arginine kinase [Desulfotalea psychrophila LSv54]|uniref:Related to arginine kinase n=1 Tax=Desulfotalea psychrophila (strain LSv54 / DSM 12343) TaxID=177439 RepID=Q6APG0_DESPS|nr:related to arginine kinase [Desulfotalea psychrophila LSv54]
MPLRYGNLPFKFLTVPELPCFSGALIKSYLIGCLSLKSNPFPENAAGLAKKYLSPEILQALKGETTDSGFTLAMAIRSGVLNPDSSIGIYAGDAQSYRTFAAILHPIIEEYHGVSGEVRQESDLAAVTLANLDPEGRYIRSSRVRVARNLRGFPFTNHLKLEERRRLEEKIVAALSVLADDLRGEYHSFELLGAEKMAALRAEKLIFSKGDRFQEAAGFNADFPKSRGIFFSADKGLRIWLGEEDHMRIISQEGSADLAAVFNRLGRALTTLEASLDFVRDESYGYLSSCPTNIGTTMRAGVHIYLEKLNCNRQLLDALTEKHDLQIRGTGGEKTEVDGAVFDISNRRRLGISERQIITGLHAGLQEIIEAEKSL